MDRAKRQIERIGDIVETFDNGRYSAAIAVGADYFLQMMKTLGVQAAEDTDAEVVERLMRSAWLRAALEAFPSDDPNKVTADVDSIFALILMDDTKPVTS